MSAASPQIVRSEAARLVRDRRDMREHLSPFIKKVFGTVDPKATYLHNWHIDLMSEHLEAVYHGEIQNLIINVPPRFLKSICTSVAFPAWLLGKDASEQILCGSYAAKLSIKNSVDCRSVMNSEWYRAVFPETAFTGDQNEKTKYVTTKRGHRIATSVGAAAIGEGGNYLLLDDPVNPKETLSDIKREAANEWIDQSWSTRKNNPRESSEILIMQRLHIDDPTGHLLKQGGFEHLVIPQEAPARTVVVFPRSNRKIVRQEGELLHEERVGEAQILQFKRRLGSYGYAGQQQQSPTPLGGGRIKLSWFGRYRELPAEFEETIISYDTAQKPKQINNPSVGSVFQRAGSTWYLTHIWKDRVRYPDLKQRVKAMAQEYSPDAILIEDKSSGSSLIQELNEDTDLPVIPIEPEADKVTRMDTQTPSIEAGLVALPDLDYIDAPWLNSFETNVTAFPSPNEWDEIDTLSQALKFLRKRVPEEEFNILPFSQTGKSTWRSLG